MCLCACVCICLCVFSVCSTVNFHLPKTCVSSRSAHFPSRKWTQDHSHQIGSSPPQVRFTFLCMMLESGYRGSKIGPLHFQAGGSRTRPNLALVFWAHFMLQYVLLRMHVCFCCVCFCFPVLSQEIGWEEHLRNDSALSQLGLLDP